VSLIYLGLYLFYPEKIAVSLSKAAEVLVFILPIFMVVILFTALINLLLKPEKIATHLGSESGLKGWLIAMLAGVISHGPMYAWYPMIEDLKKHGLKNGLIATFFYARSLKLPLLPLMIEYFGWAFTIVLSVYVLIASLIQGMLVDRWCRGCETEGRDS
jgi:uncharacterized membrane protein YraQ (UPF0718 family)